MPRFLLTSVAVIAMVLAGVSASALDAAAAKYLVQGSGGPGPATPEEGLMLLENLVLPTFEMLLSWESEGKAVGGLPVGDRAFIFIVDAASNHDVDRMIRALPAWPVLEWTVTPLESVAGRAEIERQIVEQLKLRKAAREKK